MGVGVYVTSPNFFFLKMEEASGFQTPSEDSLELCQVWQKMINYIKQPQVKK